MKRLLRSNTDKKVSGLLAGIGEYFDVDPTLIRLAYVFLTVFTGVFPGIIAYFIMVIITPTKSEVAHGKKG